MTSIYSLICLGFSSKLIGSLPRSNWALFNPQGENNASDPNKTKWLALTRDLKGTLNSFLQVLVSSWLFQSCVYTYGMVVVQGRGALVSSALGKKYWQMITTRKPNSNATYPFKKRTTLWRKKKSLKDAYEFGRITPTLKSHESLCGGHKRQPGIEKSLEFV